MIRDGRDVAASIYKRFDDLDAGVDRWIESNQIALKEEGSADVLIVRYEDLVTDTINSLKSICEFIGILFDERMLDYHKKKRTWFGTSKALPTEGKDGDDHNSLRNWQVNQPIFDGRGKWRSVIAETPERLARGEGRFLMEHFGYDLE